MGTALGDPPSMNAVVLMFVTDTSQRIAQLGAGDHKYVRGHIDLAKQVQHLNYSYHVMVYRKFAENVHVCTAYDVLVLYHTFTCFEDINHTSNMLTTLTQHKII